MLRYALAALLLGLSALLPAAPADALGVAAAPVNDAASRPAVKLLVTGAGLQRVTGAELADQGIAPTGIPSARLRVRRAGAEIPLHVRDGGDGRLDPADELRFYAPAPGDRWNRHETYWLTIEPGVWPRIGVRPLAPGTAQVRREARERGVWRAPALYDSTRPGPDGDHWFAADLRTGPGQPVAAYSAPMARMLPAAPGASTLTIAGTAYSAGPHQLRVSVGGTSQTVAWSGDGDWLHTVAPGGGEATVLLELLPGAQASGIEIDSLAWEHSVALDLGGHGAQFEGVAGVWSYELRGAPRGALYDISDPAAPQLLADHGGGTLWFEDGPDARTYLLAGPGTVYEPGVAAHQPRDLAAPRGADAIYIVPRALEQPLAPLAAHRVAQGYQVAVVAVEEIYDAWSYGQVSPSAIRSFLRHAEATWSPAPRAVTLVGDGTSDPFDHTARGELNVNLIPPYLALVDPWMGETACEFCYAQLDGDDPLDDELPDLALGRLPVKSAGELEALVAKIIGYETRSGGTDWRSRVLFLAEEPDEAGDFATSAERSIALQPNGAAARRVYYDPLAAPGEGRQPDAARARLDTIAAINDGAGIVTYVGHSHQWQWGLTDPALEDSWLLGLYDADRLTNYDRLPVVLAMTCLSSAFQTPARSGTTVDERLLLQRGGAAAVWGPTGQSVLHGHELLQRGFFRALWSGDPDVTIGRLALAGYRELHDSTNCCRETIRTYALLGDPLMPVRVSRPLQASLPLVQR
jgi:hypothetical protein